MLRLSIITTLLLLVSCSQSLSSDISSNESRSLEEKPQYDYASLDGLGQKSHYVAGVDYDIELKTNSGIVVCRGNIVIFVRSSLSFEFPDSKINCGSAAIDITKILAGLGVYNPNAKEDFQAAKGGNNGVVVDPTNSGGGVVGGGQPQSPQVSQPVPGFQLYDDDPFEKSDKLALGGGAISLDSFSSDGTVLYASDLFGTKFEPPRPLLIGPLLIDPVKYQGLEKVIPGTATKNGRVASGTHKVTVLETGGSYINDYQNVSFDNIIHWKIEHEGFKELAVVETFLPKKVEVKVNTQPLMLPELRLLYQPIIL